MQQQAGWYPNPENAAQLRWWDGSAWTDHTHPLPNWQPGWEAPPRQKRRLWPFIVFPLLGLLILMGISAAIFVPKVISAFKGPIDAANVYYRDVRDARSADAYARVCTPLRREMSYEEYLARVRAQEQADGHIVRFNAHQVHRVSGHGDEAIVDMDLTTTQRTFATQVQMLKENGRWRFCGRGQ